MHHPLPGFRIRSYEPLFDNLVYLYLLPFPVASTLDS